MAPKQLSVIFILTRQGKIALQNRHGRRMERSTGQQLKMIPLCDQQPFLLQLELASLFGLAVHRDALDALGSIARGGRAAQPAPGLCQLVHVVPDALRDGLTFQLTEHGCDVHHRAAHGAGRVKTFPDGHKVDAQPSQFFNQAGKVADVAADAVQTVDHNGLEFPVLGRSHHLFEVRAVQIAAGKALVLKDNGMFRSGISVVGADIFAAEVDLISDTFALAGIAGLAGIDGNGVSSFGHEILLSCCLAAVDAAIILAEKPGDYETFLQKLEQQSYEVKRGKYTAVKGKGQKRFIRFRTLGTGYGEDEIKAVLEGKAKHQPHQKQPLKEQSFQLLVDIQGKMAEGKSVGYKKWATKFNLKEMSKTLLFLQEQKIGSAEELRERAAAATERYHTMGNSIKAAEARLTEIAVLKTHIINYAKTRPAYDAYRKSGYSKKFLEAHWEEITLHKAAKAAFDEAGMKKLPKVKELDAEYAELLIKKKAAYPDYRKARDEMQQLMKAQKNVELFFAEDKSNLRPQHTR